jgi:hypothetical protein
MPYLASLALPGSIPTIVYISAFVALELRSRAAAPAPLEARVLSWLFLALGFYQFRYMSFFILFSTVVMAFYVDRVLPGQLGRLRVQRALFAAGLVGLCALPLAFAQMKPALAFPSLLSKQDALYVQARLPNARLLNHWNVGGLLIFYTRGAVPVFVDGRAATAYPDDLLRDYFKLAQVEINEADWDAVLQKYRIDAVLWPKAHEELRHFLVDGRGWKEEYAGGFESLYVKP